MRGRLLFFVFGLLFWLSGASFCRAQNAQNQVVVSAVVLEHITFIQEGANFEISTNLKTGFWDLESNTNHIIVARF